MARGKPHSSRSAKSAQALPPQVAAVNLHAAGIDVGADAHDVAVPPSDDSSPVRCVGACTVDLEALADWLATCDMTTVALEATGVDSMPLFELLETRGFEVLLVDPQPVQNIKGRPQSDVHDCQWWQRLHTFGLLAGAFRPTDQVGVLRSYVRPRGMLLTYASQHLQHRQKALTQMHLKRQQVVSDITGMTGRAIIRAILGGERDPVPWAKLRHDRCQHDEAAIAKALHGQWRAEHLFALAQAVALYDVDHQQSAAGDRQIEAPLRTFAEHREKQPQPAPRPRQPKRKRNQPGFEVRGALHRMTGVDLTAIEGIDDTTALILVSAIGFEMSRGPTVKHCASWLGLCPHQRVSGGKVLSRRTKVCANRAATALRLAASCLHHSQSALGAFFRRLKVR
jgi:transposase